MRYPNGILRSSLILLLLNSCGPLEGGPSDLFAAQPRISDAVWFMSQDVTTDPDEESKLVTQYYDDMKYVPKSCFEHSPPKLVYLESTPNDNDFPTKLRMCIVQMKTVIDRRFEHWSDAFSATVSGSNALLDVALLGVNGIGAGVGGVTSQALNGLSAFLTGTRSAVNNDYLYQKSVQILVTQMKTDRAKWDTVIQGRLQATQKANACKPSTPARKTESSLVSESHVVVTDSGGYTKTVTTVKQKTPTTSPILPYCDLATAWADLETYSEQGSFNNALLALSTNASAQSAACQAENVNVRQASSTGASASGSPVATNSTATAPCPAQSPTTNASDKSGAK